jgi:hypothetical protein
MTYRISDAVTSWFLAILSVLRLYKLDDRMITECGAVGGMRIGRGN